MLLPTIVKHPNDMSVSLGVVEVSKNLLHPVLRITRRYLDQHWHPVVAVSADQVDDGASIFAFVVQIEGEVLHWNI